MSEHFRRISKCNKHIHTLGYEVLILIKSILHNALVLGVWKSKKSPPGQFQAHIPAIVRSVRVIGAC
jgi:hypothetical protein